MDHFNTSRGHNWTYKLDKAPAEKWLAHIKYARRSSAANVTPPA